MKTYATLPILACLCVGFPANAWADTNFGLFPGVRFGAGRGPYRGVDSIDAEPASGRTSWATLYEFHLDSVVVFEDFVGVGVSGSYLSSSISNPTNDVGNDYSYGGWGLTGVGMIAVVPRLFLSVRGGGVFGTLVSWNSYSKHEQGSTGLRFGGGITYALLHNDVATLGASLNIDRLTSGKATLLGPTDVTFGATLVSLGVIFALNMDD